MLIAATAFVGLFRPAVQFKSIERHKSAEFGAEDGKPVAIQCEENGRCLNNSNDFKVENVRKKLLVRKMSSLFTSIYK